MLKTKADFQKYAEPVINYCRNVGLIKKEIFRSVTQILDFGNHQGCIPSPTYMWRGVEDGYKYITDYALAAGLTGWLLTKPIVVFDPDFERALLDTDKCAEIPSDRFEKLKGNPVYFHGGIKPPPKKYFFDSKEIMFVDGLFAYYTDGDFIGSPIRVNEHTPATVLVMALLTRIEDGEKNFISMVCTQGPEFKTVASVFQNLLDPKPGTRFESKILRDDDKANAPFNAIFRDYFYHRLVYWLSDMPDAVEMHKHIPVPKRLRTRKHGDCLVAAEQAYVRVLGTEIGQAIRDYRDKTVGDDPTRTVRPHIRRAHWHTYGTGPGRKVPKLLWLHPIFVHATEPAKD